MNKNKMKRTEPPPTPRNVENNLVEDLEHIEASILQKVEVWLFQETSKHPKPCPSIDKDDEPPK